MAKKMSFRLAYDVQGLTHRTPVATVTKIGLRVEKYINSNDIDSMDSDSLYYAATYFRIASLHAGGYKARALKFYKLALQKASDISHMRVLVDMAAYTDAVCGKSTIAFARKELIYCLQADIGIVAYAGVAIAMSYDTGLRGADRATKYVARAVRRYESTTQSLKKTHAELQALRRAKRSRR